MQVKTTVENYKPFITTNCIGETRLWESRDDAIDYFFDKMIRADYGTKRSYETICFQLAAGKNSCSDTE